MSPERAATGIGPALKALRVSLGWSQGTLEERSGIQRAELSFIEIGRNQGSSWRVREALARAFGVEAQTLAAYFDGALSLDELLPRLRVAELPVAGGPEESGTRINVMKLPALVTALRLLVEESPKLEPKIRRAAARLAATYRDPRALKAVQWIRALDAELAREPIKRRAT